MRTAKVERNASNGKLDDWLINNLDITLSPRISPSHDEPKFSSSIDVSLLAGSGITNGTMVVNAHCRNCKTWNGGSLDFTSTTQSWIYAVGPSQTLQSDSTSATIYRHDVYGKPPFQPPSPTSTNIPPETPSQ